MSAFYLALEFSCLFPPLWEFLIEMKKLFIYISILIVITGIFSPIFKTEAADPQMGTCTYTYESYGKPVIEKTRTIKDNCKGPDRVWEPDTAPSADTALGTCTYTYESYGTQKFELTRTFKTNCTGADRTWKESTLAEFQAEKAAKEGTGGEKDDGFVGPPDPYYHFLAPLPCEPGTPDCDSSGKLITFDPSGENKIGGYLNVMIRIFIGMCAVLAVIMIVVGGIEYMTSELISNKENGKHRITGAIFGLVLALGAWTLLNTINPDLLKTDLTSLQNVEVVVDLGGEGNTPLNETTIQNDLKGVGIVCPKDGGAGALSGIAQSYVGHSTYSMEKRNTTSGGIAYVDCSSYLSQVYVCAGLRNPGGTSLGIFGSGSTPVTSISTDGTTINGVALKIGDLIGWTAGGKEKYGHVMMYVGGGKMIDAQGQGGVAIRAVSSYAARIKFVKKL